jgi:hypothetical protein
VLWRFGSKATEDWRFQKKETHRTRLVAIECEREIPPAAQVHFPGADDVIMASPWPAPHSQAGVNGAPLRRTRDLAWGRPLFLPPELTNPRVIFDPLPFRCTAPAFPHGRKSSGGR